MEDAPQTNICCKQYWQYWHLLFPAFLTCKDYRWTLRCLDLSFLNDNKHRRHVWSSEINREDLHQAVELRLSGEWRPRNYDQDWLHWDCLLDSALLSHSKIWYSWYFMIVDGSSPRPGSQMRVFVDFRPSPCTEESDVLHSRHCAIPLCLVSY